LSQKRQFFGENILKIITSVPGHPACKCDFFVLFFGQFSSPSHADKQARNVLRAKPKKSRGTFWLRVTNEASAPGSGQYYKPTQTLG
jgi:hypothetical protein